MTSAKDCIRKLNLRDESEAFIETVAGGPLMEAKGL